MLQLIGWLIFICLPILLEPEPIRDSFLSNPITRKNIFVCLLEAGFFYLNYHLLVPRLYLSRRFGLYAAVVVLSLCVITLVPLQLLPCYNPPNHPVVYMMQHKPFGFEVAQNGFLFTGVLLFSLLLRLNQQVQDIAREKLDAELAYLKAQINPHFLFNSLNSIYALALEKSDQTAEAVVMLAGLMRFVLSESQQARVALDRELAYVQDYVALQRLRLGDTTQVEVVISGDPVGKRIAPLLLIPFVENAFKYGVNPEQPSAILLQITLGAASLHLRIENNKVVQVPDPLTQTGLGIENTRQRLSHLYPASHSLHIHETETTFTVDLTLNAL